MPNNQIFPSGLDTWAAESENESEDVLTRLFSFQLDSRLSVMESPSEATHSQQLAPEK